MSSCTGDSWPDLLQTAAEKALKDLELALKSGWIIVDPREPEVLNHIITDLKNAVEGKFNE